MTTGVKQSGILPASDQISVRGSRNGRNGDSNKLAEKDRAAHSWFRFVLSYPPHLVRHYLEEFGMKPGCRVLDPFCGTGTTVVECRKNGIGSVGIEANRMAFFATQVKVDWSPDPGQLVAHAEEVAAAVINRLAKDGISDAPGVTSMKKRDLLTLPPESMDLLLTDSISPLPLHKTLVLCDELEQRRSPFYDHQRLALARALVFQISNLHFGPEVGVEKPKEDAAVVAPWLACVREMAVDLAQIQRKPAGSVELHYADARDMARLLCARSIDAVITSPPYPNEKDYTRTTRLESVLLGFLHTKHDLKAMKHRLVRSNTRNVYKDDADDVFVADNVEVQRIADEIERRRIELGKTSGFERMYAKVTRLYFGGMARHLSELRGVLRPGAQLAYVVGDQASYLRVMIRTGQILADIAKSLGYEVVKIDLFRTRLATATKEQLREEVVVLRWPGPKAVQAASKKGSRANGKRQSVRDDHKHHL
jgi:DNA modification methylase